MKNRFIHLLLINLTSLYGFYYLNYWILVASVIYLISLSIYKKDWKNILITILINAIIFLFVWIDSNPKISNNFTGRVTEIFDGGIIVTTGFENYYVNTDIQGLNVSDKVLVEGTFEIIEKGTFDIYARSKGANVSGYADVEIVREVGWRARNILYNNVQESETLYASMASVFLYDVPNDFPAQELSNTFQTMGVSHIVVISGFHITMIMNFSEKLTSKITKKKIIHFWTGNILGILFSYFTFGPLTSIRAIIYKNIQKANNHWFWNLTPNNSLALTGIIFLALNPFSMMTVGMILSFGISFLINIVSEIKVNSFLKIILISMGAFIISTPFISTFNSEFNLSSPLISVLITFPTAFFYGVMILILPFQFMWPLLEPMCWLYISILEVLSLLIFTVEIGRSYLFVSFLMMAFCYAMTYYLKPYPFVLTSAFTLSMFAMMVV